MKNADGGGKITGSAIQGQFLKSEGTGGATISSTRTGGLANTGAGI